MVVVAAAAVHMAKALRVLIVDDHPIVLEGLATRFLAEADIASVHTASSLSSALERFDGQDVVILDLALPDVDGDAGVRAFVERDRAPLVLSANGSYTEVMAAVRAGASGYLTKSEDLASIVDAVRKTAAGQFVVSATLAGYLRRAAGSDTDPAQRLTTREREILQLIAEGEQYKHIAKLLGISEHTIGTHLERAKQKLGYDGLKEMKRDFIRGRLGDSRADAC